MQHRKELREIVKSSAIAKHIKQSEGYTREILSTEKNAHQASIIEYLIEKLTEFIKKLKEEK